VNKKKLLLAFFVFLILIGYAIFVIIKFVQNPTDTFLVEKGEVSLEETSVGYILRDETIVQGENYKNGIVQIKNEGEKVSKGEAIFRYYSNGEENLLTQIKELNRKIDEAMDKESTIFSKDTQTLEEQITTSLDELYHLNDLDKITEHKKEINEKITKKAEIIGEFSPSGSYLKDLISEKNKLREELDSTAEYVTSPLPGVVSYRVDVFENILTTSDFSYLNEEFLEGLNIKTGQMVAMSNESRKNS